MSVEVNTSSLVFESTETSLAVGVFIFVRLFSKSQWSLFSVIVCSVGKSSACLGCYLELQVSLVFMSKEC